MDRLLKQEIKSHYQNEIQQGQFSNAGDEDDELQKKCYNKMDQWQKQSDDQDLTKRLKDLGLHERKGLDGQAMLYPTIKKERKLQKNELNQMVNRLYTVKQSSQNALIHLNDASKKHIQEQKIRAQKAALLKQRPNKKKQDSIYDEFFFSISEFDNASQQNSSFL